MKRSHSATTITIATALVASSVTYGAASVESDYRYVERDTPRHQLAQIAPWSNPAVKLPKTGHDQRREKKRLEQEKAEKRKEPNTITGGRSFRGRIDCNDPRLGSLKKRNCPDDSSTGKSSFGRMH
jgi:hypothetical protein